MKKVFYEKQGRRYVPVKEYDSFLMDSFPRGAHLVICYPGGSSTRYNIDPNYAAMIAAGRVAEDKICDAMVKASELRPQREPLTPGQVRAWNKLKKEFGDERFSLQGASVRDCAEAGIKSMMEEANELLKNPAVRKAFDYFQMVCDLTREHKVEQ